jgi:hypothetical protein
MIDEKTINQIEDYFSGELSGEESKKLLLKVEDSDELREHFEDSSKLWNYMASVETIEPSPDFIRRFWKIVSSNEEKNNRSFFKFNFMNLKWKFVYSLAVFLLLSTIIVNNFVLEEEKSGYVYEADDELLIENLEEALSKNTTDVLNVYGPWEDLEN